MVEIVIVRKIDRNPLWETNGHRSHDMAILTLDKEIEFGPRAFPICLPFDKEQMLDKVRSKHLDRAGPIGLYSKILVFG